MALAASAPRESMMEIDRLVRKLEQFQSLSAEDKGTLDDTIRTVVDFKSGEDIIGIGDRPDDVHLVIEGWAGRYKILPEGERHIMAYLIPGDFCDAQVALLRRMDHSIGALSHCKIAFMPREKISDIITKHPRLAQALWWATLVDEAILREWLVTRTRRADKRVAHLICEMLLRAKAVGLTDDDSFQLPLTQETLGDTMGLSTVHMNRTLQDLRSQELISSEGRRMIVHDFERLKQFADFDPIYLHQEQGRDRASG
jgi:CRP-like cAMP-binding protein